jgi:ribosomal protein L35AE/L33A
MMHDGHLSIGLLDLELCGGRLDAQEVIVGGIHDHLGYRDSRRRRYRGTRYVRYISLRDEEKGKKLISTTASVLPKNDGSRPLLAEISRMLGFRGIRYLQYRRWVTGNSGIRKLGQPRRRNGGAVPDDWCLFRLLCLFLTAGSTTSDFFHMTARIQCEGHHVNYIHSEIISPNTPYGLIE